MKPAGKIFLEAVVTLASLILLTDLSFAKAETSLKLRFGPQKNGLVRLTLENLGKKRMEFFDSLMPGKEKIPYFIWIKARSADTRILTENTMFKDGYWSPHVRSSHATVTPVALTSLEPNQRIEKAVSISALFFGLEPDDLLKSKTRQVRLKLRIYLDAQMSDFIETESEWLPFSFNN